MNVERTITVSCSEIASLNEALSWVVQHYDSEFTNATMVNLSIQEFMVQEEGETEWRSTWTAMIAGVIEES